ncbi:MAG: hypothetical protein ACI4JW_05675 [Oscillospiraceae bacterium]
MAKKGMKRPEDTHTAPRNEAAAVPQIQGKAKRGNAHVNPIIAGMHAPQMKVYHSKPHSAQGSGERGQVPDIAEKPIADVYKVIDTDLARDNLENDIPDADLQDM